MDGERFRHGLTLYYAGRFGPCRARQRGPNPLACITKMPFPGISPVPPPRIVDILDVTFIRRLPIIPAASAPPKGGPALAGGSRPPPHQSPRRPAEPQGARALQHARCQAGVPQTKPFVAPLGRRSWRRSHAPPATLHRFDVTKYSAPEVRIHSLLGSRVQRTQRCPQSEPQGAAPAPRPSASPPRVNSRPRIGVQRPERSIREWILCAGALY